MRSAFLDAIDVEHPIIQAPMGGANATPPALVSAVSNAGGLGFLGAAYMPPEQIARETKAVRAATSRPFGINLMALVPQMVRAVRIPVLAAGGIMNGAGIAAALALGAAAAQMGTAFLTTDECGIPESYKRAIVATPANQTRVTRAFSGRPARGIVNRAMDEIERSETILPYPYQNSLTRAMRTEAAKQGRIEYLSLWAGQGGRLARRMPAAKLVETLVQELRSETQRFQPTT